MSEILLDIQRLQVVLTQTGQLKPILAGVNLQLFKSERFSLIGESGSGKSMTSLAIMQLLPNNMHFVDGSSIIFQGADLTLLPEAEMQRLRGRKIAMIFQEPMTALNPVLTIHAQIDEVLQTHFNLSDKLRTQKILALLNEVGLPEPALIAKQYPHQLSGGMKQRVMIAIALAGEPDLLIADEATSALDVTIQAQILNLLEEIQSKRQMTLLFITHDLSVARSISDRVGIMYAGELVEIADKDDFFAKPLHPYSQKLLQSIPTLEKRTTKLASIPGQIPEIATVLHQCRFASRCQFMQPVCTDIIPANIFTSENHLVKCLQYDNRYQSLFKNNGLVNHSAINVPQITNLQANKPILQVKDLKIYYPIQKGLFRKIVDYRKAVDDVNFAIYPGRTLALVGESGCGKTTIAKAILQLQKLTAGEIYFENYLLTNRKNKINLNYKKDVQIIFQDPFSSMNPRMLVGDIIAEGLHLVKKRWRNEEKQTYIAKLLQQVGLPEQAYYRYPHEFSGGQRQRICIARALAVQPKLIICDEPTSALDVSIQAQILNLLKELQDIYGLSYLFITHNLSVVAYLADDIAIMRAGKIIEYGTLNQVLKTPKENYTRTLLSAILLATS